MTLNQYLENSPEADSKGEVWEWTAEVLNDADLAYVRETVENECRLPECAWDDLLMALGEAEEERVPEVMTEVFRSKELCGPDIPEEAPIPKGRALSISRFRSLMRQAEVSPDRREQIIEDVRSGFTPAVPYSKQLSQCDLGEHLIWSTFREKEEEGRDPFRHLTDPATVRDHLGLRDPQNPDDPEERGLVLLVYRVPSTVNVKYPTIADAYAGSGWNPNFQCSDREDPWGYTSGGRPEVVHDVIRGKQFILHPSNGPYTFAPLRIVD